MVGYSRCRMPGKIENALRDGALGHFALATSANAAAHLVVTLALRGVVQIRFVEWTAVGRLLYSVFPLWRVGGIRVQTEAT
jgi:hypothetical protein